METSRSCSVFSLWIMYLVAATASSAIFIVAGRRSRRSKGLGSAQIRDGLPGKPSWGQANIAVPDAAPHTDASAALHLVLGRLTPVMISKSVQADIAAPPGLWVHMRASTLTELLEELLATAIHGAPTSRILLLASQHGDRVHISVTDDMPGSDPTVRRACLRGLTERVAVRGGELATDVQPSEGTTMTLRLAAAHHGKKDVRPRKSSPTAAPIITGSALSR